MFKLTSHQQNPRNSSASHHINPHHNPHNNFNNTQHNSSHNHLSPNLSSTHNQNKNHEQNHNTHQHQQPRFSFPSQPSYSSQQSSQQSSQPSHHHNHNHNVQQKQRHSNSYLDNTNSLHDMIQLLKQYQKLCLDKLDFNSAEQAKNKIQFLKSQEIILKKQKLQNQDKQNMENISKIGQEEIKNFQEYWDQRLKELIENLKEIQKNLEEQHQKQLIQAVEKLQKQEPPKMKYSSQVLDLRKYLRNLIKIIEEKQKKKNLEWKNIKRKTQNQDYVIELKQKFYDYVQKLRDFYAIVLVKGEEV